ncbi:hypothetical protein C8A01DRAFT_41484 [Parachaetomium inaequale]|uniref:Uncharacterized protein n=1 Tax=Parachaetomium inaequale TaxID=2588326 RepID=A0AAN6P5P0_9PEZI|nr:hypothetical protein C8A01DRAFT_41484 [Parachaetomium inaequale]
MLSYIGLIRNPSLKEERARLKGGRYQIKGSEHEGKIQELTKLIAKSDRQEEEEYVEPAIDLQIPERAQLTEILCNQPDNLSPIELLELRIQAAELMVILCGKREEN